MDFQISKKALIEIVKTYQEAQFQANHRLLTKQTKQGEESLDWLLNSVRTDEKHGISTRPQELKARKDCFGTNEKEAKKKPSLIALFCEALNDFILKILIASAIISIALQVGLASDEERGSAWVEGFAILVAVFVCAGVAAINNYQKEMQFIELNSVADEKKKVTVWRDGQIKQIHQDLVLVGDIVAVNEGMQIPADGVLIRSNQVTIDESSMTGETNPVVKNTLAICIKKSSIIAGQMEKKCELSPVIMGGTRVLTGQGKMVIVVVGNDSCMGKIRALLEQEEQTKTPLEQKLEQLANDIGKFALTSAILIVVVLFIRFAIVKFTIKGWDTKQDLPKILNFFILAITIIVMAIPQGLPLSVTLSLAFSVKKMLKDQNLVRRMQACETMGGANNICSDKTGTLTMNKMVLTEIWNGDTIAVDTYAQQISINTLSKNQKFIEKFKIACLVNSSALLYPQEKGSSTQIAFLKYFKKLGINYEEERNRYQASVKFPFSSKRKMMSVIIEQKKGCGFGQLFVKGASEIVLKNCTHWMNSKENFQIQELNKQSVSMINDVITAMANKSLRTLCLGYREVQERDLREENNPKDSKGVYKIERQKIILLAVVGVRDNPRKEVPSAISKCHIAGITVRMVTGDNIVTAKAIAKEIGLLTSNDQLAMQGTQFNNIVGGIVCKKCRTPSCPCPITAKQAEQTKTDIRVDTVANAEEFDKIIDRLIVLARSRPEDKYCLVTGLKERGNVVAVTGDGTNDAPALKKADVGFAMGIAGTQVAREAAAIILVDDNFNSIVKAVLWGRNIYDSIRKFLQFQLTINVAAVLITFVGCITIQKEVMKPIQILWLNLIMDSLASVALSTENPHEKLLLRKPYTRDANIVSKLMKKSIVGQSIYQIIVMGIIIFLGQRFIPQYEDSYDTSLYVGEFQKYKWSLDSFGKRTGFVCSGRFFTFSGQPEYETAFIDTKHYSRHFTFVFNTFVMLQLFNFINARKIHDEFNVFKGALDHAIFCILFVVILAIQILIVTFGGYQFGLYPFGLTPQQWGISIAIGSTSLIIGVFIKLIPYGKEERYDQIKPIGDKDVYNKLIEDN